MVSKGPSPEYRDLLDGRITPEEYVEKLKREAQERLERDDQRRKDHQNGRAATAA